MFNNYTQPFMGYPNMSRPQPQPQMFSEQYMPQQNYIKPQILQGKTVDNIEVVKATDIPLDYSISYFPIADGSAIVTKQLMPDGTSKTMIYKPTEQDEKITKYITSEELENIMNDYQPAGFKELRDEVKNLKRQIRDIADDVKDKKGD